MSYAVLSGPGQPDRIIGCDLAVDALRRPDDFLDQVIGGILRPEIHCPTGLGEPPKDPPLILKPNGFFLLEPVWKRDKLGRWMIELREKDLKEYLEERALEMEKLLVDWDKPSLEWQVREELGDWVASNLALQKLFGNFPVMK